MQLVPAEVPKTLHWFKWEAAWTWITGFLLLVVVYYLGSEAFLVDPGVFPLGKGEAVAFGIALLVVGWVVYDGLYRSPLATKGATVEVLGFVLLCAATYAICRLFPGRAAYVHIGAMIGTIMVANVWMIIIPAQKKLVAATKAGTKLEPRLAFGAKQRSVHNNYMTLPVLFLMVSNHYPMVIDHPLNWLLVAGIGLSGVTIRHFFNRRNAGASEPMILVGGALIFLLVMLLAIGTKPKAVAVAGVVPFREVQLIVRSHCIACHSASPTNPAFASAPNGVAYDTPEEIRRFAPRIYERAVATESMPLGNETGMTKAERDRLGAWIKAGAK
jgi:uncharacterized membrane protein